MPGTVASLHRQINSRFTGFWIRNRILIPILQMRTYTRLRCLGLRSYNHEEAAEPRQPPVIIAIEMILITYKFWKQRKKTKLRNFD